MAQRIKAQQALLNAGFDRDEWEHALSDSVVPACCDEGCETEPDGHCEHGYPSVCLALGII